MEEIWKDIEGYEGLYQVSNLGRVKSLNYHRTRKEQLLKPTKSNRGYFKVYLNKNGKMKTFNVHRLVAQAFIENPNNYPCVNHKDENKINNIVDNLEYCTVAYNNVYGTRVDRVNESRSKPIYCLETDKIYKSIKECAKELNLHYSAIIYVLKGKYKHTGGYTFRYAKDVLYKGGK